MRPYATPVRRSRRSCCGSSARTLPHKRRVRSVLGSAHPMRRPSHRHHPCPLPARAHSKRGPGGSAAREDQDGVVGDVGVVGRAGPGAAGGCAGQAGRQVSLAAAQRSACHALRRIYSFASLRHTFVAQSAAAKLREVEHKSAALLEWYQKITGLTISVVVRARALVAVQCYTGSIDDRPLSNCLSCHLSQSSAGEKKGAESTEVTAQLKTSGGGTAATWHTTAHFAHFSHATLASPYVSTAQRSSSSW